MAVKVFRPGTGFDMEEDLHGEAVILARLHHPGLVTAYDAGQHDGRSFLVMQLVEGTTLKKRIARGALPTTTTAVLGTALAGALAHAHDAGVVHRDVKPSNILLDSVDRPYLTDFGISRMLDASTRTATGTLVGTAAYLSPEQVLGRPVDVYALGLVLLECLTGSLEYDGGPLEAAIARLHRPPVLPRHLPQPLADLLRNMTDLDEHNRPTAHECGRTLAQVADNTACEADPPVPTATVGAGHPSPRPDRTPLRAHHDRAQAASGSAPRRRRALTAAGTMALAAATATALTMTVTEYSPPQEGDPRASRIAGAPAAEPDPGITSRRPSTGAPERPVRAAPRGRNPASADPSPHTSTAPAARGAPHTPQSPTVPAREGTKTSLPNAPSDQGPSGEKSDDRAQERKGKKTTREP
ncbi:serine/threonine protein kinase [Streptomyces chromofuscus]|nr:serine/threonine protein kinase [Streptomyces chromofuscus]